MSEVHATIEINAPQQEVWETIMDPRRLSEWVTIHKSVDNVSTPLEQGSTMQQVLQMHGVSFKVRWTLTEVTEPSHAEWEGRGPARSYARIRYELSDKGENCTAFKYTNEFTAPGGVVGNTASNVLVGGTSQREANKSLRKLKALLER